MKTATHMSSMADSFKSSNSIANLIQKWASENSKKVGAAIHFKGGWEGWAQVEIAYEMVMAYSNPMVSDQHRQGMKFDVAREEKVYKNKPGDIVDLVIHMLSNAARTDARDTYLIELKCESRTFRLQVSVGLLAQLPFVVTRSQPLSVANNSLHANEYRGVRQLVRNVQEGSQER